VLLALLDILRCPAPHDESALIARVDAGEGGHMRDGVLGCPVCHREYAVRGGVVYWADAPREETRNAPRAEREALPQAEDGLRLAALLAVNEARRPIVLAGARAAHASQVGSFTEAHLVLVNPSGSVVPTGTSVFEGCLTLPFAGQSVAAVALDAEHDRLLASAVAAMMPGARAVCPSRTPLPAGLRELTRDDADWVAERVGSAAATSGGFTPLRRNTTPQ